MNHSLVPMSLALITVRHAVYGAGGGPSADGLAGIIAASVPVYEYFPDGQLAARGLRRSELRSAIFRRDGTELHFSDGRKLIVALAVRADDVQCVVDMLKHPADAAKIQSRWTRLRARALRAQSADLAHQASDLRKLRG